MKTKIELTTNDVRNLIVNELQKRLTVKLAPENVQILVRSKQNYREHEFEHGEFQVTYEGEI
jgi:hypothetical protein